MKQELIERLNPIVEGFVDRLLGVHKEFVQKNEDLQKEVEQAQKMQADLKVQTAENARHLDLAKDKLAEERVKAVALNNEVKDEIAKYSVLNKSLEEKLATIDENFKSSKIEKELISEALEKAKKKESEYGDKLHSLKKDCDALQKQRLEINDQQKRADVRQKVQDNKDGDLASKINGLNDFDLKLKAREKEVNRLIKRYELEKFIKEQ